MQEAITRLCDCWLFFDPFLSCVIEVLTICAITTAAASSWVQDRDIIYVPSGGCNALIGCELEPEFSASTGEAGKIIRFLDPSTAISRIAIQVCPGRSAIRTDLRCTEVKTKF